MRDANGRQEEKQGKVLETPLLFLVNPLSTGPPWAFVGFLFGCFFIVVVCLFVVFGSVPAGPHPMVYGSQQEPQPTVN